MSAEPFDAKMARRMVALVRKTPVQAIPAPGRTPAGRWIVRFADGTSAFVKAATCERTAAWLREEYRVYAALRAPFMPDFLAWEDGERPLLVLEDLSAAHWPPPWCPGQVEALLSALEAVRKTPPPAGLPPVSGMRCWGLVARQPEKCVRPDICDLAWLEAVLPAMLAAEEAAPLEGEELLHLDVRSDNVCFQGSRAVLVDWNWACRGNGLLDVALLLPGLHMEGGPPPESILPDAPEWAALICGFWFYGAFLPGPAAVYSVRIAQLRGALPWAVRTLGIPMPRGFDPSATPPAKGASV